MTRDSTAVTAVQHSHGTASSPLDRVEAGLIAKMENRSPKKDRHKHSRGREEGKEAESPSRGDNYDGQSGKVEYEVTHKKKKKKHHRHSSQAMSSQISSQDVSGMSADLDVPQRYFPTPAKRAKLEKLDLQDPVVTQVVEPKQAVDDRDDEKEDDENVRPKEERRRRKEEWRVTKPSLEAMKTHDLEGVRNEVVDEEKIVPETPRKEKRKLDTQVYNLGSHPGSTLKVIPRLQVGDNFTEEFPKHKKQRKFSQESPLRLHTVSAHSSPSIPGQSDEFLNDTLGTSERKKKKMVKEVKSKGRDELAKGALFEAILKGCASPFSNNYSTSGEVRTTPSIDEEYSSEHATEGAPRLESPSPIKPPKSRVNVPNSISPIHPKKETGSEFRKETPILPPKRQIQNTKQSPVSIQDLARFKKEEAKPVTYSESDDRDGRKTKKRKESASQIFKAIKTSKGGEREDVEDPFVHAMDSIRRSSSIMQNLFSPAPTTPSASIANKKKEQSNSFAQVKRERSASTTTVLPLVLNEEGVNMAREDWEVALGKLRSSAGGDDDSEAQENIAFSSSYISSRSAGIKISNTTFQVHNLRHNEGWVASTPSSPVEDSGKDFKLKICNVISGQVQVRLGNDGFGVSKGSVFRVRSGEDCLVRNGEKKVAVVWVVCVE